MVCSRAPSSDDGGEPAFGTEVQAYRFVWQEGERTLRHAGSDTADDRGSFRIGALPPGEYLVMAMPAGKARIFDDIGFMPKLGNVEAMSVGRMVRLSGRSDEQHASERLRAGLLSGDHVERERNARDDGRERGAIRTRRPTAARADGSRGRPRDERRGAGRVH